MKFTQLKIENFLAITEADIKLADRGLVLIQGLNDEDSSAASNGAGKSSLADAICWCAFGTTARGVTGDEVINHDAGKGTRVTLYIEDGDDIYRITRHRKHPKGKNGLEAIQIAKDGTATELTKGTDKLTQEVVGRILGASLEVFKSAVYAGQEQMPDLPAMTDKHLKLLIEEAAGVTVLEEAYKEARADVSKATMDLDTVRKVEEKNHAERQWVTDQITTTIALQADWERQREARLTAGKNQVVAHVTELKRLDVEIAKVDNAAINTAIADFDKRIAAVSDESVELSRLARELAAAEGGVSTIVRDLQRLKQDHERGKSELAGVQHKIGCPCDECGRPLTEAEMASATAAAKKKLDEIVASHAQSKSALEIAQKSTQEARERRDRFQASMTDVSQIGAQRAQKQAELNALASLARVRELEAVKAKNLGDDMKRLKAEANPHDLTLTSLREKAAQLDTDQADVAKKVEAAQKALEEAEAAAKVFSPSGVRAHILDDVTPFLNQQTSKYLSVLSDGNIEATWTTLVRTTKGELREKFSIEVVNSKGAKSFAGLSGGEKRKVRVAAALSLQDLVATRAVKPIDFFVGDEIDDALDQPGLERLTEILEEKAKERGSVFVISHRSLRDWIPNVILVERRGGKTIITETTA